MAVENEFEDADVVTNNGALSQVDLGDCLISFSSHKSHNNPKTTVFGISSLDKVRTGPDKM